MILKILLAVDASPHAEKTVRQAVELAKLTNAKIVAMHAFKPPMLLHRHATQLVDDGQLSLEEQAKHLLETVAERIAAEGLEVSALAVEGEPVEAIRNIAAAERPDLIVIGSRGENRGAGGLLGGVAEHTVRNAQVSVLVVK